MNDWRQYFNLSSDFRTQKGQTRLFELAANVPDDRQLIAWLVEFVTGYGKTIAAYGVYHILRKRGLVDHMLVLVPTDDQRTQFAGDADDACKMLGIQVQGWTIDKLAREPERVRKPNTPVFVATYQQLDTDDFFRDLLTAGGKWIVVADECHHLGEKGVWARHFLNLPQVVFRLGLSATPVRTDFQSLSGLPAEPIVRVTYQEAFKEEVVKRVLGKIDNYYLDVEIDGRSVRLTTESLREEGVTDFNQYETRRQLRYNSNYLNRMLIEPLQELALRNSQKPGQHQMIVFCMSCRHAHFVSDQINRLVADLELPFRADWVGVGEGMDSALKSSQENKDVLESFRKGGLHILVQVGKAQEGFNVKTASVLLFLHLIGADARLLQQIGRGLRRNSKLDFSADTVTVFGSSDTPLAELIKRMEAEANDALKEWPDDTVDGPTKPRILSIPDLVLVGAEYRNTEFVQPNGLEDITPASLAFMLKYNIPLNEYIAHFRSGHTIPEHVTASYVAQPPMSDKERLNAFADQVKTNLAVLTGNITRIMASNGYMVDGRVAGKVKNALNGQWKYIDHSDGHAAMLPDDFERKNRWLQEVNREIQQTGEVPSWVAWYL